MSGNSANIGFWVIIGSIGALILYNIKAVFVFILDFILGILGLILQAFDSLLDFISILIILVLIIGGALLIIEIFKKD